MKHRLKENCYEVTEVREWIGEKWCIVCNKDVDNHSIDELGKCMRKVQRGYRLA